MQFPKSFFILLNLKKKTLSHLLNRVIGSNGREKVELGLYKKKKNFFISSNDLRVYIIIIVTIEVSSVLVKKFLKGRIVEKIPSYPDWRSRVEFSVSKGESTFRGYRVVTVYVSFQFIPVSNRTQRSHFG